MRCGKRIAAVLLVVLPGLGPVPSAGIAAQDAGASRVVTLEQVLASVESTYPPLLAAMIERDVREGRLRSARGILDLDLFAKYKARPDGYYEYSTVEAGAEQFLGIWGASVYGGYRLARGDELPSYYDVRTNREGEGALGLRLSVLKGGLIDKDRAELRKADVALRGAGPVIDRQRLDFVRAASVAYFKWVATGQKLLVAQDLLAIANERQEALEAQVEQGLRADIVLVDNRRLVVSRELEAIAAQQAFEASALALSLFYRGNDGDPLVLDLDRLPKSFVVPALPAELDLEADIQTALEQRPEVIQLQLDLERIDIERSLARNSLLPTLDASIETARSYGDERYPDLAGSEVRAGLDFKMPLQLREARGRAQEVRGQLSQAEWRLSFARDRIDAEVRSVYVALTAALEQTQRADLNVQLALELQAAEEERFRVGASDLLALQLREQAAFDAQSKAIQAYADFFIALADYQAAIAVL